MFCSPQVCLRRAIADDGSSPPFVSVRFGGARYVHSPPRRSSSELGRCSLISFSTTPGSRLRVTICPTRALAPFLRRCRRSVGLLPVCPSLFLPLFQGEGVLRQVPSEDAARDWGFPVGRKRLAEGRQTRSSELGEERPKPTPRAERGRLGVGLLGP